MQTYKYIHVTALVTDVGFLDTIGSPAYVFIRRIANRVEEKNISCWSRVAWSSFQTSLCLYVNNDTSIMKEAGKEARVYKTQKRTYIYITAPETDVLYLRRSWQYCLCFYTKNCQLCRKKWDQLLMPCSLLLFLKYIHTCMEYMCRLAVPAYVFIKRFANRVEEKHICCWCRAARSCFQF